MDTVVLFTVTLLSPIYFATLHWRLNTFVTVSPLLMAVESRIYLLVDELLNYGADPLRLNGVGLSALSQACASQDPSLLSTFARRNFHCDVKATDN